MSELTLNQTLEEDIKLISGLENVEIKKLEDSIYENGPLSEDESNDIQFEDSSQGSEEQNHRFEVKIRLKECIFAISKRKDSIVTLIMELRGSLSYPLIEVHSIKNSSINLKNKCEYYFENVSFSGSSGSNWNLYKIIVDFKSFLQMEAQKRDLHEIRDSTSNLEDLITLSLSSGNDSSSCQGDLQFLSSNPYQDCYKNVASYNERYRDSTKYNSMTIKRKDKIYTHLNTHSRYFREFKEETVLGSGSFGRVTKVQRNGINYAVKQIPIFENYESILHEEAAVLASLQHPNIVRYYDAWLELSPEYLINKFNLKTQDEANGGFRNLIIPIPDKTPDDSQSEDYINGNHEEEVNSMDDRPGLKEGKDKITKIYNKKYKKNKSNIPKKCLFILMEYCGEESLLETINKHTLYETPQRVIELFRQIMEALSYIHEKGIIHRDVKPSNLFLKFENEFLIKLGDFGLTAKLQQSKGDKRIPSENGLVGTLHYMAPEQLECDSYNEKVDIYSAGVVLFEMLSKPFQTFMERSEILSSFSTQNKVWPEGFRERIDNRLVKLLESMLNINPNKRPSASEILQNEIFTSNKLNLQSLYTVITQYPHSMESVKMLNTMFSRKQQYKKLSDYYNTVTSNNIINYVNLELGQIYDKEFKLRKVNKIHLSLLTDLPNMFTNKDNYYSEETNSKTERESLQKDKERSDSKEKNKESNDNKERLLLSNGRCCYLRYSLLYSFAECIQKEMTTIMRRYALAPVYTKANTGNAGGRNINYYLGYDIIADYLIILNESQDVEMNLDSFFTYELISVASRPLKRFLSNCTLHLEWNHAKLIKNLLTFLKMPEEQRDKLESQLMKETQIKGKVGGLSDEASAVISKLHKYLHNFKGRMCEFKKGLESLFEEEMTPELTTYFDNLQFFEKFLTDFEGTHQFNPIYKGLTINWEVENWENWYQGGEQEGVNQKGVFEKYYFKISLEVGRRNFGEFIFGGCYNKIIENNIRGRNAFGLEMNLQPIYDYFTQNMVNKNLYDNLYLNYAPEVVVYTPQLNLITVVTSLESKFWNMGVKCYKKVGGQLNIKRITRLKKHGLFSLQRLKYLITIKKITETQEIQYIIVDIDMENKDTFGGEDNVLEKVIHNINPN